MVQSDGYLNKCSVIIILLYYCIIIDSKLSFIQHIDSIVNKALKNFSMFKRLCPRADGNTFLKMYKTYILSILENFNLGFYTVVKT